METHFTDLSKTICILFALVPLFYLPHKIVCSGENVFIKIKFEMKL